MGSIVGEVEKERFFGSRAALEVVGGPIGEDVGGVALRADFFLVESHVVLVVAAMVVVVVHHVPEESVEVIKAARVGVRFFIEAKVPFPDRGGGVALFLESLGEEGGGRGKVAPVVFFVSSDDAGDADEFLVFPAEESGAGG